MNQKSRSGSLWVATLTVPLLFGVALLAVRSWGFLAVSDDDYSRVVIAQQFAQHPQLDPSGTSWLPFPFWVTGGAMLLFGGTLAVATTTTWILSVLCSALLVWLGLQLRWTVQASVSASLAVCLSTSSLWLGNATVPEFSTAALCTVGALSLLSAPHSSLRLVGASSLFLATASRYEAWPLGLSFLAWNLTDLAKTNWRQAPRSQLLPLIAACFPFLWMGHGWLNYDNAFFFFKRVSDYKKALGHELPGAAELISGYPHALISVEPLPCLVLAASALIYLMSPKQSRHGLRPKNQVFLLLRPLSLVAAQLVVLLWGASRGGAPTHHPERALLASWMILLFCAVHLLGHRAHSSRTWTWLPLAVPLLAFGHTTLSPRLEQLVGESRFRTAELKIGQALGTQTALGHPVALLTPDYGYFAIMAAAGDPGRFTILNRHDPRSPQKAPKILDWMKRHPEGLLVAPLVQAPPAVRLVSAAGELGLYRLESP